MKLYQRYEETLTWLYIYVDPQWKILDLGHENELSLYMREVGYEVENTDFDLDMHPERIYSKEYGCVTAFEVLEHLVDPLCVLKRIDHGTMLICTVPIRVWFKKPHWIEGEPLRQHYHEFLPREFRKLLNKAGFTIVAEQKKCITRNWGIRPFLTKLFNIKRYLFVIAIKGDG